MASRRILKQTAARERSASCSSRARSTSRSGSSYGSGSGLSGSSGSSYGSGRSASRRSSSSSSSSTSSRASSRKDYRCPNCSYVLASVSNCSVKTTKQKSEKKFKARSPSVSSRARSSSGSSSSSESSGSSSNSGVPIPRKTRPTAKKVTFRDNGSSGRGVALSRSLSKGPGGAKTIPTPASSAPKHSASKNLKVVKNEQQDVEKKEPEKYVSRYDYDG